SCGALLPTGNAFDDILGIRCTLIDNGMPCVVFAASDVGVTGYEDRDTLDANAGMKARIEAMRLAAGPLMNLGDVQQKSVPKMMLVAAPEQGGAIAVRSLIPHRVHASIGVLGAVSVATACLIQGSPAAAVAVVPDGKIKTLGVEHPSGITECVVTIDNSGTPVEAGMLRTARKLMDGEIFA
ncbi:MAG: 4-oxalomesaconate tautomerase, partial [Sphingomonadales bacterium]